MDHALVVRGSGQERTLENIKSGCFGFATMIATPAGADTTQQ